jgi:thiosulfate reductase cytochrome b subunit
MQNYQHPLYVKICHWVNALAIFLMVTSGWRIYNASPIFEFKIPKVLTIGGWLGGALEWHFAAMWLLAANGLIYLLVNTVSGRMQAKFLPIHPKQLIADFRDALMLKLDHSNLQHYNAVQKSAYLSAMLLIVVTVLSGLAIWKSVQLPLLREVMGGYDNARIVHFFGMSLIVGFVFVHLVMVALVPETLTAMIGRVKRNKTLGANS